MPAKEQVTAENLKRYLTERMLRLGGVVTLADNPQVKHDAEIGVEELKKLVVHFTLDMEYTS